MKLQKKATPTRTLRSNNNGTLIDFNKNSKTFEKQTAETFNQLPANIRSSMTLSSFKTHVKNFYFDQALARNL